ncbi:MAG: helix-turn-helix transcriptional regulator, partial [Actinobacteria bacterium]|nr:helix-turn-helix transcriptional regulator [Actinomycetota bacterium]
GHRGHRRGPGGPRRGGFGPGFGPPERPPWPGFGPGFGPWGGGEKFFMRGPRVKRGDVRLAALALLAEEPRNGYQIIQEISERSGGLWRPSPGSVYPALQQLEDEGLIQAETGEGGRRRYALTSEGREYVAAHEEQLRAPWDVVARSVGSGAIEIRQLIGGVAMAAVQVARAGSEAQFEQATRLLSETQRGLYRILAADDEDAGEEQAPQE